MSPESETATGARPVRGRRSGLSLPPKVTRRVPCWVVSALVLLAARSRAAVRAVAARIVARRAGLRRVIGGPLPHSCGGRAGSSTGPARNENADLPYLRASLLCPSQVAGRRWR